jgi:hypothetical protein
VLPFAYRGYLPSTLGAKFVVSNRAVAAFEQRRRRADWDLVVLPVTNY